MTLEKGDAAAARFETWRRGHDLSYFRSIVNEDRTALVRTAIMAECHILRTALRQNNRIRQGLKELEDWLRREKVLVEKLVAPRKNKDGTDVLVKREKNSAKMAVDAERLSKLEKELAAKNAELEQLRPLKSEIAALRKKLRQALERQYKYEALESVLAETGRLPR